MDVQTEPARTGTSPLDPHATDPARLKQVLASHGFLGGDVRKALGAELGPAYLRRDLPLYLRRLEAPTPLNTILKLFVLAQSVDDNEAAVALAPIPLAELVAAGLTERGPRGVRALVGIAVHGDLLLAHDQSDLERLELARDHVLGTNAPAMTLDCLTVRRPARATLDLGVGGGVQSIRAARHSGRVVAVDKNPRALAFARFNARMNGAENVECREGDFFGPVAGERFDLVVCNPPYVISPDSRFTFQDSGRPGDALCEEIVRRIPRHLEDGGFATILCNWALGPGEDWSAPVRRWVEGSGCDAWLLHGDTQDPLTYAAAWNRGRERTYAESIDHWRAYYRSAGIERIVMGAVILRRRNGANWVRADALVRDPQTPCGEHIQRVFAGQDRLTGLTGDADVLAQRFRLIEDHVITQKLRLRGGDYVIEEAQVELATGIAFRGTVDPYTLHLLRACDGRRPLGEAVDELAKKGGVDRGRLSQVVAETARSLAGLGFLVWPEDEAAPEPPRRDS